MGAHIVVGGQWGDEAKGLISAYLNAKLEAKMVGKGGTGSNAEHGIFLKDEKTYIKVNQLPLGWIFNRDTNIRIGSGVAVNPYLFLEEIRKYKISDRTKIDFRCPIVEQHHMDAERDSKTMSAIGSTMSGTGYCRADFVLRKAKQAKDIDFLEPYLCDIGKEINDYAKDYPVIIESSQGTFLSLAVSSDYPNTTSDNVTSLAAADDVLLNWKNIEQVYLIVKALPTREGKGSMGAEEFSMSEIKRRGLTEISSIGGAVRRKATSINFDMLKYACEINGATKIALTFCDHYDKKITHATKISQVTDKVWNLIEKIEKETKIPVTLLNTGKSYNSIIDLSDDKFNWAQIDDHVKLSYESLLEYEAKKK